jgi:hypothetical protein
VLQSFDVTMDYSIARRYFSTFKVVEKNSIATTYFTVISVNAMFESVANDFVTTRRFMATKH